jgi:hypothetical protein
MFAAETLSRQPSQFVVDQWDQLVEGFLIAVSPLE